MTMSVEKAIKMSGKLLHLRKRDWSERCSLQPLTSSIFVLDFHGSETRRTRARGPISWSGYCSRRRLLPYPSEWLLDGVLSFGGPLSGELNTLPSATVVRSMLDRALFCLEEGFVSTCVDAHRLCGRRCVGVPHKLCPFSGGLPLPLIVMWRSSLRL